VTLAALLSEEVSDPQSRRDRPVGLCGRRLRATPVAARHIAPPLPAARDAPREGRRRPRQLGGRRPRCARVIHLWFTGSADFTLGTPNALSTGDQSSLVQPLNRGPHARRTSICTDIATFGRTELERSSGTGAWPECEQSPEVTLASGSSKIMSTTVGETGADYLAVHVGLVEP